MKPKPINTYFIFFKSKLSTLFIVLGIDGIIKKIRETVGDKPAYLSIDVRIA